MPHATLVPVTGVIKGAGRGADKELGPNGDPFVGAGAGMVGVGVDTDGGADTDDGAGTNLNAGTGAVSAVADAGYEDGAVAEPEGFVCLDADKGIDRLAFPAGGAL